MATEATGGGLEFHPMDQFVVSPLFGDGPVAWYTPTNVTLWLALTALASIALLVLGTRGPRHRAEPCPVHRRDGIRPGPQDDRGHRGKDGLRYFPYILTLFMFVVFANLLGLLPLAFTTTSHIAVTGVLALAVFFGVTIIGFVKNGAHFLDLFWVRSAPLAVRPVLAVIEVISYFVRPLSLSIRLAGNMIAGHAVIKVFAGFAAIAAVAPVAIIAVIGMYAFEVLVAIVQAYVFTILTCVYLKDALHPSH